jgi:tetratricopeptide (TPR) repeat protein
MSNQGAYLLWKLVPRDKVFIDGLNAYPLSWYREYHEMINGREDAARVIARWKIRYFLLDEEQLAPLAQPQGLIDRLVALGWRLVYYDGHDLIYVPDIPENHNLIARHAYEYLRPGGIDPAAYRDHPAELTAEVERMIAGNPQSPYARDTAGWVRLGLGDPVGAAGEFEAEARLARNPMSAYLGLAQVSAAMGRDESAVDYFRKALRLSSGDPGIHRALAEAYERRGRFREAVAERKRVVRVEPQNPAAHYELAGTYRAYARQPGAPKERLLRDAVSELRIAFELSPNPEIAYALGAVFMAMDQPRAAIREFTLGIELDAAWPGNYRGLARAYEALNDREAAIRAWRDFLSREPDPTSAAEARARLKALQSP